MKVPEEKIYYTVICEQMPSSNLRFETYEKAKDYAKNEQLRYRPYYIVEIVEHYEMCGVVGDKGKEQQDTDFISRKKA